MDVREAIRLIADCAVAPGSSGQVCVKWGLPTVAHSGAISELSSGNGKFLRSRGDPCCDVTAAAMSVSLLCPRHRAGQGANRACFFTHHLLPVGEISLQIKITTAVNFLSMVPCEGSEKPGMNRRLPGSKVRLLHPTAHSPSAEINLPS